jgi:uncharacterized lipoprotein NlpE involved in copper resistance
MANLSTQNIGANYKGILNLGSTINTPLSTTLRAITDGDGNTTPLQLATNRIALGSGTISGTSLLNFPDAGTTAADGISFGSGTSNLYRSASGVIKTDGELISTSFKSVFGVFASNTMYVSNSAGLFLGYGGGGGGLNLLPNQGTTVMAKLNATGQFDLTPPTLTGSSATSALSISQTWNTTGNPSLIFANVTNTASGASANLMDLQVGGSTIFKVDKNATLTCGAANTTIIHNGTFSLQTAGIQHFRSNSSGTNIGTGGLVASARLSVESTTQGFLPPRMTTTQKNAIASPAAGLMVYDTTLNQMSYYNGTAWVNF